MVSPIQVPNLAVETDLCLGNFNHFIGFLYSLNSSAMYKTLCYLVSLAFHKYPMNRCKHKISRSEVVTELVHDPTQLCRPRQLWAKGCHWCYVGV